MKKVFILRKLMVLGILLFVTPVMSHAEVTREEAVWDIRLAALYTAEHIHDLYYQPWMLSEVAVMLYKTGDKEKAVEALDNALQVADTIDNKSYRRDALMEVVTAYNEISEKEKALAISGDIIFSISKAKAYRAIAESMSDEGRKRKASALIDELIKDSLFEEKFSQKVYIEISGAYAYIGETNKALESLERIDKRDDKALALKDLAVSMDMMGDKEAAKDLLNSAMEDINLEGDITVKISALNTIAAGFVDIGMKDKAYEVIKKSYELTHEIKSGYTKPIFLNDIVSVLVSIGRLDEARKIAVNIDDDNYMPRSIAKVASAFASEGKKHEAYELLKEAEDKVSGIRSHYTQASVMYDIVLAYLSMDDKENALRISGEMKDDYSRPRAFAIAAHAYAASGQSDKAMDIFIQALDSASAIDDNFYKSWALSEIALEFYEAGLAVDERVRGVLETVIGDRL